MSLIGKQRLRYATNVSQIIERDSSKDSVPENYFHVKTTFHNFTSYDIYIETQNRLQLPIDRHPAKNTGQLIVCEEFTFNFSQYPRIIETLKEHKDFNSHQSTAFKLFSVLSTIKYSPAFTGDCRFHVKTIFAEEEIEQRGTVYSHHLNMMISLPEYAKSSSHPFADSLSAVERYAEQKKRFNGNVVAIDLVSNDNEIRPRYAYLLNTVVRIDPIVDYSRASGVYITKIDKKDNQNFEVPDAEYFTFDDAEKECGLYKTVEEALAGGDLASANAARLKEAQVELETMKNENLRISEIERQRERQHESEMARLKQESIEKDRAHEQRIRQLNQEHNLLRENEEFRHKAEMAKLEKTAQERKAKSEMIKLMSGVATGAITVFLLMNKNKKESK